MVFPHQTLLKENNISTRELPKTLRELVVQFDLLHRKYEIAEQNDQDEQAAELLQELNGLSGEIVDEIKDFLSDNELQEEEELTPPAGSKKQLLEWLYTHGVKQVSKKDLNRYGYPTGFTSSLTIHGDTVGEYRLKAVPGKDGEVYDLFKTQ